MRDPYQTLGIARDATKEEIKAAYRRMAMKYHRDRNQEPDATEKFSHIRQAYELLMAQGKGGGDWFSGEAHSDHVDLSGFSEIFGTIFGRGQHQAGRRQEQVSTLSVRVPFSTYVFGGTLDVTGTVSAKCADCAGTGAQGKVMLECPVCFGEGNTTQQTFGLVMRFSCHNCQGEGHIPKEACYACSGEGKVMKEQTWTADISSLTQDDSFVVLQHHPTVVAQLFPETQKDSFFVEKRKLFAEVSIRPTQAALGGKVVTKGLDGAKLTLEVPPGTQSGDIALFERFGGRTVEGGMLDLYVVWRVVIPDKLSEEQRKIMEELEKTFQQK